MTQSTDLGHDAVDRIARLWQVDDDRVVRTEHGFDWWPSRYKVSVFADTSAEHEDGDVWRLVIRTEFLRGVDLDEPEVRAAIAQAASLAATYGWVYVPMKAAKRHKLPFTGAVWFQSTAYICADNAAWLPEFIGRLAILQPIDAHLQAETFAPIVRAYPDVSGPQQQPADDHVDGMLGVARDIFVPDGREESRWQESDEFADVAERFGKNDQCFGMGDAGGLTLETPVGSSSALIRLQSDVRHPRLGSGLSATLYLPFRRDEAATQDECLWLNFFESFMWAPSPMMGSWSPYHAGDGEFLSAHVMFIPNALFGRGLVTNAALWQLGRARWAKQTLYPDLKDLTMHEILKSRFGDLRADSPS